MTLVRPGVACALVCGAIVLWPDTLIAHGVARGDARFLQSLQGAAIAPLMYLGAKHMITGYDHLLFLVGVIFFLHRLRDVVQYEFHGEPEDHRLKVQSCEKQENDFSSGTLTAPFTGIHGWYGRTRAGAI